MFEEEREGMKADKEDEKLAMGYRKLEGRERQKGKVRLVGTRGESEGKGTWTARV